MCTQASRRSIVHWICICSTSEFLNWIYLSICLGIHLIGNHLCHYRTFSVTHDLEWNCPTRETENSHLVPEFRLKCASCVGSVVSAVVLKTFFFFLLIGVKLLLNLTFKCLKLPENWRCMASDSTLPPTVRAPKSIWQFHTWVCWCSRYGRDGRLPVLWNSPRTGLSS